MKYLILPFFFLFSNAYAAEVDKTNIDCSHYIATTTDVMQEVQNGKNIKQLMDIAMDKKNKAVTSEEIEAAKIYAAYSIVAYKEPIGKTTDEKQEALIKAALIGKMFCEKQKNKI